MTRQGDTKTMLTRIQLICTRTFDSSCFFSCHNSDVCYFDISSWYISTAYIYLYSLFKHPCTIYVTSFGLLGKSLYCVDVIRIVLFHLLHHAMLCYEVLFSPSFHIPLCCVLMCTSHKYKLGSFYNLLFNNYIIDFELLNYAI